jgi:hypothetical protein
MLCVILYSCLLSWTKADALKTYYLVINHEISFHARLPAFNKPHPDFNYKLLIVRILQIYTTNLHRCRLLRDAQFAQTSIQTELLRFVEEKTFNRVGGWESDWPSATILILPHHRNQSPLDASFCHWSGPWVDYQGICLCWFELLTANQRQSFATSRLPWQPQTMGLGTGHVSGRQPASLPRFQHRQ